MRARRGVAPYRRNWGMKGLDKLREGVAEFLRKEGIDAVTAWDSGARIRRKAAVVAVSLRAVHSGPAGLRDYLGERFNEQTGRWEELYGKRAELTLGLDIYGPEALGEGGCTALFARLSEVLADGRPEGLTVQELSCAQTEYLPEQGRFCCRVQARCGAYLTASADEKGEFTDFTVRGTRI